VKRPARLLELTHLLAGRRSRTIDEIARRFDISPRTAYRDLAELEGEHIPVTRDERGYRLLETAHLRPLNLTAAELAILRLALGSAAIRRQPSLSRRLRSLEAKLDAATSAVEEEPQALAAAGPEASGEIPEEIFRALEQAVQDKRPVEIHYASLSGGTRRWRGVDPYEIFHRSGAWYVVGRCHVNRDLRTFRLDRVSGVRSPRAHGSEHFERPREFNLDDYLRDSWGVFRGEKAFHVVIRFDPDLAPLIENAHHHEGEEIKRLADGRIEYRARVSHLDEIARWVVGFGGKAVVVEPEALSERVRSIAAGVIGEAI